MVNVKFGLNKAQVEIFKREYAIGRDAARRCLSFHQNPHTVDTVAYDAWARGWKAGRISLGRL